MPSPTNQNASCVKPRFWNRITTSFGSNETSRFAIATACSWLTFGSVFPQLRATSSAATRIAARIRALPQTVSLSARVVPPAVEDVGPEDQVPDEMG